MKTAILVPLYKPRNRHLLLLKSVLSRCDGLRLTEIHAVADGPQSDVEWPDGVLTQLLAAAHERGLELHVYSALRGSGYPGCYRSLLAALIADPDVTLFHFIDQDDYCLPGRFSGRSRSLTQAASVLVASDQYLPLTRHAFDSPALAAVLETPSLGMTFSVPRQAVIAYLDICQASPFVTEIAHDFVFAQLALRQDLLDPVHGNAMVYIQHEGNAIGYGRGLGRIFRWARSYRAVLAQLGLHARLLDILYAERAWLAVKPLHRSARRAALYRMLLSIRNP